MIRTTAGHFWGLLCCLTLLVPHHRIAAAAGGGGGGAAPVEKNFCAIPGCMETHIACKNDEKFADTCVAPEWVNMEPHIKFIVNFHNTKRNEVAAGHGDVPAAGHMAQLVWDFDLEYFAALSVASCKMVKKKRCRVTNEMQYIGELIGDYAYTGEPTTRPDNWLIQNRLTSWFSDYKNLTIDIIKGYPANSPVGRSTLMLSETNNRVGCAAVRHKVEEYNHFLFACNYATNNLIGRPVYTFADAPAKSCQKKNKRFVNLCHPFEVYDNAN